MTGIRSLLSIIVRTNGALIFVSILVASIGLSSPLLAQDRTGAARIVPFSEFLSGLHAVTPGAYVGQPNTKVRSAVDFDDMRKHLLNMYSGVTVTHSFVAEGQIFDCVPLMQQPSVRLLGVSKIATPPPLPQGTPAGNVTLGTPGAKDAFGNIEQCAEGTIPMRRITLDELTRYETLQQFFKKVPSETMQKGVNKDVNSAVTTYPCSLASNDIHCWVQAYQGVNNYGGAALHNVWVPYVNTLFGQGMSLSQQWYTGGSGSAFQTAEIGWQNQPLKWGGQKAVVFIYWTRNNYNGTGCYNLECPGFVQTSSNHPLGLGLSPTSTLGGSQYEVFFGYFLYQGNWWAAVGSGTSTAYWLGYYPGSIYQGGQLSKYAQGIEIGGEVAYKSSSSPPMGSGQWASSGFGHAAYERGITYRDSGNGGHNPIFSIYTSDTKCFTYTLPSYSSSNGWLTYFYFGGPGGLHC